MLDLSVIILSWNTCQLLEKCLTALVEFAREINFETIVIDNGSTDGSQQMVRSRFSDVRLIENEENLGFAGGNNQGIRLSKSPFILLLNSDAFVTQGALENLLGVMMEHPKAGIVGAQLINPDGSFQASHTPFPGLWQEFLILSGLGRMFMGKFYPSRGPEIERRARIVDYVEGACLLVRRDAVDQAGMLSEEYFMYAEEMDWCFTMKKAGWEVWYQPEARIIHYGGASSKNRPTAREGDLYRGRVIFFKKHYGNFQAYLLKVMIGLFVGIKNIYHSFLRWISGGKRGRRVISLKEFHQKMRGV
jgi:GT2 family glycosyltransferase